jgi:hypothetical protein
MLRDRKLPETGFAHESEISVNYSILGAVGLFFRPMRPTARPVEYTTKLIEDHLRELEETILEDDEHAFDELAPRVNVNPKLLIAKDLPKIEVKAPAPPIQIKRKPYKLTKKTGPSKVDIEYNFQFEPVRLEVPPFEIPPDYGYDYMTDQLVDLTYQFTRLTVPDPKPD